MIAKRFYIDDLEVNYSVGINQISINLDKIIDSYNLNKEDKIIDFLLNLSEKIQNTYKDTIIQFFADSYVLNQDHILTASYYVQKAFYNKENISKNKNIEFLLYLATQRQIKKAIEFFGIDLVSKKLNYCIISTENNLNEINKKIIQKLAATEVEITLNNKTVEKFNRIKNFYEISDNQIKSVLKSYGFEPINRDPKAHNLEHMFIALYDLICEKMSLLSLEKIKLD